MPTDFITDDRKRQIAFAKRKRTLINKVSVRKLMVRKLLLDTAWQKTDEDSWVFHNLFLSRKLRKGLFNLQFLFS